VLVARTPLSRVALSIALPAQAVLISQLLRELLEHSFEPVFIASLALVAWLCGTRYGLVATLLSAVAIDWIFLAPQHSLEIDGAAGITRFFLFMGASSVVVALIHYARATRAQLTDAELRYRALSELIPFGGWIADGRGNMLQLSESFLKTFGTDMERCKGVGWTLLLEEADRLHILDEWRRCLRSGYFWDYEYRLCAPSGEQYIVLSRGVPVPGRGRNDRTWVGFHLDITQRERDAEKRVEQARDIARFNAELEQFAYVSAHDLQEPLRMVASYLQLLSRKYKGKLDPEADTFIGFAVEGAERLKALLQDLLELQQIGKRARPMVQVALADIVEKARMDLAIPIQQAGASIVISELPVVEADEVAMVQLFTHLLDNALKYRKPDVSPEIRISAVPEAHPGMQQIRVQDNGIGIEPEFHKRIFDVFQRLHPRQTYPGTGIGLAICKKIVEVHGGHVAVESEPGVGSTFCVTLPVVESGPLGAD
jgi:PAS domain S-box-containing protein